MTKRLTAEEVASDHRICDECERLIREHLVPQWQDAPGADGWYWCERLDADAAPQLIRETPDGLWWRWTVSGWSMLVGRVAPIGARPK